MEVIGERTFADMLISIEEGASRVHFQDGDLD